MPRRLAVIVFALGCLRVLWYESAAEAQFPWSKTKTPTRTATPGPSRTPTATPWAPTYTPVPVPSSPPSSWPSITIRLATIVVGADVTGLDPVSYEVRVDGVWRTLTPRAGGCWSSNGACVGLGLNPYFRVTARDGSVKEGPVRLTQPRVLLAQAAGPVNLVSFTTPQIQ